MSSLPPTKTQIRAWNTAPLSDQGMEWARAAQAVNTEHGAVTHQLADSPGFWRGDAADAMRGKGDQVRGVLTEVADALESGAIASNQMAQVLDFAKIAAVDAISAAEKEKFIVAEDGSVSYSDDTIAWLYTQDGFKPPAIARLVLGSMARQHSDTIKAALRSAGDAAESARKALENAFDEIPIPDNLKLEGILNTYQVEADPEGLVEWPSGSDLTGMAATLGIVEPQKVTASEAEMLDRLSLGDKIRFYRIKSEAEDTAKEIFGGEQDDHTDAFRHAYWNALMTQEFGEDWTKEYTSKHEARGDNAAVREAMDLYNNEVGRTIALQNPDADSDELREKVRQAVDSGNTVIIDQNKNLNWTNQVQNGHTVNSAEFDQNPFFLPGSPVPDDKPSPK
ncbi:WXG100 family type VII secretion target [Nocardia cyriacigeorgica]|uniref:Wnt family protein n=1 Tax=Nocardia cyriacigeorgica TaxID=135487 RepID=A0A5R8NRP5_9NOCA|nr:wnt family protein [Nocardia cyriacigeorgica]TLF78360.1 wnt family protein [Nocardia cyriacigeorgica]